MLGCETVGLLFKWDSQRGPCPVDWRARLRDQLVFYIARNMTAEQWARGEGILTSLLTVSVEACGSEVVFRHSGDIPLEDFSCPCGDPEHFVVKWEVA